MSSAARPNRAGEIYARTHNDQDGSASGASGSNKRARFDVRNPSALAPDAPEEDAVLELDEIGKRSGAGLKRNAVNLDGYDSDSSNEGFDARADAAKSKIGIKSKDEEDADMFADLEEDLNADGDEDEGLKGSKKRRAVTFLDDKEIQGQIQGSKSGGHVEVDFTSNSKFVKGGEKKKDKVKMKQKRVGDSESESDSEGDEQAKKVVEEVDEEVGAGGLKTHAPRLDAFNMNSELEEGRFDASGNFIRKAGDPDAQHDIWLDEVSKKDIRKAKDAAEKREEEERKKIVEEDEMLTSDLLRDVCLWLDKGENVLEAQARYGRLRPKPAKAESKWKAKSKNKKKSHEGRDEEMGEAMDVDKASSAKSDVHESVKAIETLSSAASILLGRGMTSVYDEPREVLTRLWSKETGDPWRESKEWLARTAGNNGQTDDNEDGEREGQRWEYRWKGTEEVYGPYGSTEMAAWSDAGFFTPGHTEFRRAGNGESWSEETPIW